MLTLSPVAAPTSNGRRTVAAVTMAQHASTSAPSCLNLIGLPPPRARTALIPIALRQAQRLQARQEQAAIRGETHGRRTRRHDEDGVIGNLDQLRVAKLELALRERPLDQQRGLAA